MENKKEEVLPEVGMAATVWHWTDRTPATVVEVGKNYFVVQEDSYKWVDGNGMSESQEYTYSPDPEGARHTFTRRKDGRWSEKGYALGKGMHVALGHRRAYYDFSF